jgi:glucans biosynthesis protein
MSPRFHSPRFFLALSAFLSGAAPQHLCAQAPAASAAAPAAAEAFTFDSVKALARRRGAEAYVERKSSLAPFWQEMKYDAHREIEFSVPKALWSGEGRTFQLGFFHPGWVFPKTVEMAEVEKASAVPIPWRPEFFNYRNLKVPDGTPPPSGYAGFRILTPVNSPDKLDELAVFLGASYFRAVAPGLAWGLSARGLALNTARPQGEEFPHFERFWFERPQPGATSLTFYALLDSPSVAGAYRFTTTPGRATVIEVEAELTFRQDVELIGMAPFSSMMWFSELTHPKPVEFRPEVHDSDGLLIHQGDLEAVWRPLDNSRVVRHSVFSTESLAGYGLIQRDRAFENYQDLEANYHQRPSVFVEPVGKWPSGRVHLIELPTGEEFWDNVVCMWEPAKHPKPGEPFKLAYRVHWLAEMSIPGLSKVLSSRRSHNRYKPEEKRPDDDLFVIDFAAAANPRDDDREPVVAVDAGEGATLIDKRVQKNPHTGGWRAFFRVRIEEKTESLELSCRLLRDGRPASEKWSYLWKK